MHTEGPSGKLAGSPRSKETHSKGMIGIISETGKQLREIIDRIEDPHHKLIIALQAPLVVIIMFMFSFAPSFYENWQPSITILAVVLIVALAPHFGLRLLHRPSRGADTDKGSATLALEPPSYPAELETNARPLHEVMGEAQESLLISGHTLDQFTRPEGGHRMTAALHSLFDKNVKVNLILLHSESAYAEAHERFHKEETKSPVKSPRKQIENTIRYFETNSPLSSDLSVYLSDYMPRFRLILIDNKACYVDLYMYATDVEDTPCLKFTYGQKEFEVFTQSVKALIESCHVVRLVDQGHFNPDWRNRGASHQLRSCLNRRCCHILCGRWKLVRSALLGNQNPHFAELDSRADIASVDYRAGTFHLGEIDKSKLYLKQSVSLVNLVHQFVDYEWPILSKLESLKSIMTSANKRNAKQFVLRTLELSPKGYEPLKNEVWFQEYSDVMRRILLTFLCDNPDWDVEENPCLTTGAKDIVPDMIKRIEQKEATIKDWLELSVVAGVLGIDLKPYHAATSEVIRSGSIKISGKNRDMEEANLSRMVDQLFKKKRLPRSIDDTNVYFEKLNIARDTRSSPRVIVFSDDYIETFFLVKFYSMLVHDYPELKVTLVPRSVRCGNDATADDVKEMLSALGGSSPNIEVLRNGPKMGGVHLRKLAPDIVEAIRAADFVDVRGARNYEMMQRIERPTFFGFMVARSTSEILTGLNSQRNPFFFKYHEPGFCSFKPVE